MYQITLILFLSVGIWIFQDEVMKVRKGEVFKIVLKSNRSTGYSWHWKDRPVRSIIDSVYVNYSLDKKMMTGAGGYEIWEFKAREEGEQRITMVYKRPWEDEVAEQKKVLIIVD